MIDLDDLEELFDDLGFDEPTEDQLKTIFGIFKEDFILDPFELDGRQVKVILNPSFNRSFRGKPETFVHLITRESKIKGNRLFDRGRANRIHWVKQILLQREDRRIKYYQYLDEKGGLKHHFWFQEKDFMVVLKPISADLLVVTGFVVDKLERTTYLRRYQKYNGL